MNHIFDEIELDYIERQGWRINDDGLLVLTAAQARGDQYMRRSIRHPDRRTLMVPGLHGCTLLLEGRHFIIVG